MHSTRVLSLLTFITMIALQMGPVTAECCPCLASHVCNDGLPCVPYCGRGPCNVLGCNCTGGCVGHHWGYSFQANSFEDSSEWYFDNADTNKDGKLSFDEWAATDQNKGHDTDALHKQWSKYGVTKNEHLTKVQAIFRTA